MEKIKAYMAKTMTWGDFWKMEGYCMAVGLLVGCIEVVALYPDSIPDTLNELKRKLPWNRNK